MLDAYITVKRIGYFKSYALFFRNNFGCELFYGFIERKFFLQAFFLGELLCVGTENICSRIGQRINGVSHTVDKTASVACFLVKKLFEEQVPEIAQGIVEIKEIAREPGQRTKMAILSNDAKVDAVGAFDCVGAYDSDLNFNIDGKKKIAEHLLNL